MDLFESAHARQSDPTTSHAAADNFNVTKGEQRVLDALVDYGPLTMEEVGALYDQAADNIGPRFKPLLEKNMIEQVVDVTGEVITRKGRSGASRIVYRLQPDASKFTAQPEYKTKAQVAREEERARCIKIVSEVEGTWNIIEAINNA